MKCILEDNYQEKQFNSVKEAMESAIVEWEYNTAYPKCIKKLDGTVIKREEEIFEYYQKWWRETYRPKSIHRKTSTFT